MTHPILSIGYKCDCGKSFDLDITDSRLHGELFKCPSCEAKLQLTKDERRDLSISISALPAQLRGKKSEIERNAKRDIQKILKDATRGMKSVKFYPK